MAVVTEIDQVLDNITELEHGRSTLTGSEATEYISLIKRGTCFLPYETANGLAFAPSRFVGYVGNKLLTHAANPDRDGRITNAALTKVFSCKPLSNALLEQRYLVFCEQLGFTPSERGAFGVARKYWVTADALDYVEANAEQEIYQDPNISETEKQQLVKARLGQGLFRDRLVAFWGKCCVTGLDLRSVLRASHIKPWRDCCNSERLDVYNGLLLSPNMDALFDKGFISFSDTGEILISSQLTEDYMHLLGCSTSMRVNLVPEHEKYFSYHRNNLFLT